MILISFNFNAKIRYNFITYKYLKAYPKFYFTYTV